MISIIALILFSTLVFDSRAELACTNPRRILAASGFKGFLSILDLEEQAQCEMRLAGQTGDIVRIKFSRDFKYLFSTSSDGTLAVWNTRTGSRVKTFQLSYYVNCLDVSRDGSLLASGDSSGTIKIWRTSDFAEVRSMSASFTPSSLLFSPDGKTLMAGGHEGSIEVFSAETGGKIGSSVKPHLSYIWRLLFTPDDKYVITGPQDNTAKMLEYPSLTVTKTFQHTRPVWGLAINPKGTLLATGLADNTIYLWDLSIGMRKFTLSGHVSEVNSVEFTSDGKYLLSGSGDSTIKVWDTVTGKLQKTLYFYNIEGIIDIKLAEVCVSNSPASSTPCSCGEQLFIYGSVTNICSEINFNTCKDNSKLLCGTDCHASCATCSGTNKPITKFPKHFFNYYKPR